MTKAALFPCEAAASVLPSAESTLPIGWGDLTPAQQDYILAVSEEVQHEIEVRIIDSIEGEGE